MAIGELRQQQANDLRAILGHNGLVLPDDLEVDPNLERDQRFENAPYGELAARLYSGFVAMAASSGDERLIKLSRQGNILNGAYVMTRILGYGPPAYAAYLENQPQPDAPVAELGNIMRRSSDIVKIFADCDIKSNHTFELNFGLLQYKPLYEPLPFIIEPDETDQPVFGPSHRTLLLTQTDIMSRRLGGDIPTEPDPAARCPAIGRVMTAFWNAGVDECVSDPGLFAAGLTETLAA